MAFAAQLITVRTAPARQVAWAGAGAVGLINRDQLNAIYLGASEGFDPAGQALAVIDPLGSLPLDGAEDVWALTRAGTAVCNAIPGGLGFQASPAQIAAQIAATGVPLLSQPSSLVNQTGTLASNFSGNIAGPVAVTQPGYEILVSALAPNTASSLLNVVMIWSDSVSGQTVTQESWWFYAGSGGPGNAHVIRGSGPTKGNTLTVFASQSASGITASYTLVVAQNSRIYLRDDWRTTLLPAFFGFTRPTSDPTALVLASRAVNLAGAGGSDTTLLPLFAGVVTIGGSTASGVSDAQFLLHAVSDSFSGLPDDQVVPAKSDANGNFFARVNLPRAQCTMQLVNNNAAAKTVQYLMTASDY